MISVPINPIINHNLVILRDKNSNISHFRAAAKRLSYALALEAMKEAETEIVSVETPLEITEGRKIISNIILLPVLRAGMLMVDAFSEIYPLIKIGFIGIKRNEETLEPDEYYFSLPAADEKSIVFILDPMIATGGSVCNAVSRLMLEGISKIVVVSLIATPEGIEKILSNYPDIKIITAALDRGLNDKGYILPGLGDAGDRFCS